MKANRISNITRIKILIWNIIKFMRLGPLVLFIHPKSALVQLGWFKSFHKKAVIDRSEKPIPWWTYSFIDFLEGRLTHEMRILEFGCGGSTIWMSNRVKEVVSVEDHKEWANKTKSGISGKSEILIVDNIADFTSYSNRISGKFDVIIIDNLGNRLTTAKNSMVYLNYRGVLIWDNTDGSDWNEIIGMMQSFGFREISFTGMIPQELSYSKTTVFYKRENCFNI